MKLSGCSVMKKMIKIENISYLLLMKAFNYPDLIPPTPFSESEKGELMS